MPKDSSSSTSTQVRRTWGIIHPKLTQEQFIDTFDRFIYIQKILQGSYLEQHHPALGEGVLKPWGIPIMIESHFPGSQDTKNWIGKYAFFRALISPAQLRIYKLPNSLI